MNFIKYFFSEIFRLFKLLVGIALVLAAGVLIYKFFFSEPGLVENYERNRVQILALRDFAREIKPEGVSFDVRFDGDEVSSMRAVNKDKNQSASFYSIDERTNERAVLKILGWDFGTFNELKAKAKSANAVGVSIWEGEAKPLFITKTGLCRNFTRFSRVLRARR